MLRVRNLVGRNECVGERRVDVVLVHVLKEVPAEGETLFAPTRRGAAIRRREERRRPAAAHRYWQVRVVCWKRLREKIPAVQ